MPGGWRLRGGCRPWVRKRCEGMSGTAVPGRHCSKSGWMCSVLLDRRHRSALPHCDRPLVCLVVLCPSSTVPSLLPGLDIPSTRSGWRWGVEAVVLELAGQDQRAPGTSGGGDLLNCGGSRCVMHASHRSPMQFFSRGIPGVCARGAAHWRPHRPVYRH